MEEEIKNENKDSIKLKRSIYVLLNRNLKLLIFEYLKLKYRIKLLKTNKTKVLNCFNFLNFNILKILIFLLEIQIRNQQKRLYLNVIEVKVNKEEINLLKLIETKFAKKFNKQDVTKAIQIYLEDYLFQEKNKNVFKIDSISLVTEHCYYLSLSSFANINNKRVIFDFCFSSTTNLEFIKNKQILNFILSIKRIKCLNSLSIQDIKYFVENKINCQFDTFVYNSSGNNNRGNRESRLNTEKHTNAVIDYFKFFPNTLKKLVLNVGSDFEDEGGLLRLVNFDFIYIMQMFQNIHSIVLNNKQSLKCIHFKKFNVNYEDDDNQDVYQEVVKLFDLFNDKLSIFDFSKQFYLHFTKNNFNNKTLLEKLIHNSSIDKKYIDLNDVLAEITLNTNSENIKLENVLSKYRNDYNSSIYYYYDFSAIVKLTIIKTQKLKFCDDNYDDNDYYHYYTNQILFESINLNLVNLKSFYYLNNYKENDKDNDNNTNNNINELKINSLIKIKMNIKEEYLTASMALLILKLLKDQPDLSITCKGTLLFERLLSFVHLYCKNDKSILNIISEIICIAIASSNIHYIKFNNNNYKNFKDNSKVRIYETNIKQLSYIISKLLHLQDTAKHCKLNKLEFDFPAITNDMSIKDNDCSLNYHLAKFIENFKNRNNKQMITNLVFKNNAIIVFFECIQFDISMFKNLVTLELEINSNYKLIKEVNEIVNNKDKYSSYIDQACPNLIYFNFNIINE